MAPTDIDPFTIDVRYPGVAAKRPSKVRFGLNDTCPCPFLLDSSKGIIDFGDVGYPYDRNSTPTIWAACRVA
jgi:hypothetical protein